jgi:hypothetical protein
VAVRVKVRYFWETNYCRKIVLLLATYEV